MPVRKVLSVPGQPVNRAGERGFIPGRLRLAALVEVIGDLAQFAGGNLVGGGVHESP